MLSWREESQLLNYTSFRPLKYRSPGRCCAPKNRCAAGWVFAAQLSASAPSSCGRARSAAVERFRGEAWNGRYWPYPTVPESDGSRDFSGILFFSNVAIS